MIEGEEISHKLLSLLHVDCWMKNNRDRVDDSLGRLVKYTCFLY